MAHFDVHRLADGTRVVDCQSDMHAYLTTRLVVPLATAEDGPAPINRLNPQLTVGEERLVFYADLASAMPVRELGPVIASVADQEYVVFGALDMLLNGI
ncbi:MAG: CcdB family protein [Sphingomonadaceae bacterium]